MNQREGLSAGLEYTDVEGSPEGRVLKRPIDLYSGEVIGQEPLHRLPLVKKGQRPFLSPLKSSSSLKSRD